MQEEVYRRQGTNKQQAGDRQNVQGEARERQEINNIQAEDRRDDSGDGQEWTGGRRT